MKDEHVLMIMAAIIYAEPGATLSLTDAVCEALRLRHIVIRELGNPGEEKS